MTKFFAKTTFVAASFVVALTAGLPASAGETECKPEWTKCVCTKNPFGSGNLICHNDTIAMPPSESAATRPAGATSILSGR